MDLKTDSPAKQATGMNANYLSMVADLLKKDTTKYRSFQRLTDGLRKGGVSPAAYVKDVEALFGTAALDKVLAPLIKDLPERALAAKLADAYKNKKK